MKTRRTLPLLALLGLLALSGCETTSFERGVITGEAAKAIFDTPEDEARFSDIKSDIVAALASEIPITSQVVATYVSKIKVDFSPAAFAIIQRRLNAELPDVNIPAVGTLDETRIREFLAGVAATL